MWAVLYSFSLFNLDFQASMTPVEIAVERGHQTDAGENTNELHRK